MDNFECHITIEPVEGERLEELKLIASRKGFKVAKLLMKKGFDNTYIQSDKDSFMTAHSDRYSKIWSNMIITLNELQENGFRILRYKIEEVLLDSRDHPDNPYTSYKL